MANQIIKGRFYLNNGDVFEGTVSDNFKMVEGKYSSKTWNYTGGFKTTATDGWLGRYYTFTFEGKGLLNFKTLNNVKCQYEGSFLEGNLDGQGTLVISFNLPAQKKIAGKWVQGELVQLDESHQ